MAPESLNAMIRIFFMLLILLLGLLAARAYLQRKLLYYPSHHQAAKGLSEWRDGGQVIGYWREAPSPHAVWLMLHGNAGQAADRIYALPSFSPQDSVYILEYPGYGGRPGSPSMPAFNAAAKQGYEILRSSYPSTPVCVIGESIGSGPASILATTSHPPDKIVLIAPFDVLSHVAAHHFPFLPSSLMSDNWNNIEALKGYKGLLEIFAAPDDTIVPFKYAKALAESKPSAKFHMINGGHNDWAVSGQVKIRYP